MDNKNNQQKKIRERSTPYPGITLENAISSITNLKKALGKGPYSRMAIAQALGHSKLTGPAVRKVAALSHYGLLERKGDVYTLSSVVLDILDWVTEEKKTSAILKAVKSPALFSKLINQFQGQSLPSRLDSILVREGIGSNAASEVVSIFTENLKYAGLLHNGVITSIVSTRVDEIQNNEVDNN